MARWLHRRRGPVARQKMQGGGGNKTKNNKIRYQCQILLVLLTRLTNVVLWTVIKGQKLKFYARNSCQIWLIAKYFFLIRGTSPLKVISQEEGLQFPPHARRPPGVHKQTKFRFKLIRIDKISQNITDSRKK